MFSGYGLYHDGVMFGLVADETLYLKADESIAHYFESKGLGQFEYGRADKIVKMSYYIAPIEISTSQKKLQSGLADHFKLLSARKRNQIKKAASNDV